MAKVICLHAHFPDEIEGIKFTPHPDGDGTKVSEEISDEAAARLASMKNAFRLHEPKTASNAGGKIAAKPPAAAPVAPPTAAPVDADQAAAGQSAPQGPGDATEVF